jgi:hypothetical protein
MVRAVNAIGQSQRSEPLWNPARLHAQRRRDDARHGRLREDEMNIRRIDPIADYLTKSYGDAHAKSPRRATATRA